MGLFVVRNGIAAARGRGPWRRAVATAAAFVAVTGASFAVTRSSGVDDDRAEDIVSALLHNVYRAFDFRDEEIIYDTLAHSVNGDLLTETYLETRRGLELASQGGARAKVQEIEMLEVDADGEGPGFRATSTWNVAASVGHWGHIHQRRNQYVAELRIEPVDGVWKITSLELIEEKYLIGAAGSLEFRDAQVSLLDAQTSLIAARFQARLTRIQIDKMIGEIEID